MNAEQIKEALVKKGYTLAGAAREIPISAPSMSTTIHQKKGGMSPKAVAWIEKKLGIAPGQLFKNGGSAPAAPAKRTMSAAAKKKISDSRKAQEAARKNGGNGHALERVETVNFVVPTRTSIVLGDDFAKQLAEALVGNEVISKLIVATVDEHASKLAAERARVLDERVKAALSGITA